MGVRERERKGERGSTDGEQFVFFIPLDPGLLKKKIKKNLSDLHLRVNSWKGY